MASVPRSETHIAKVAAIYPRVSSGQQEADGTSLETQEGACRAYALAHGYAVPDEHIYREIHTGTELWERPQLSRLRDAVRHRQVDAVIAYAIDRLSRDPVHLGVVISEADHAGVAVEFVTEPLDSSPEGQLIRFVRGYAAKVEHEKIKERTMRGKRARAESGKLLPGRRPLYGYIWNEDRTRLLPDPLTAPIVQRIFREAAEGVPLRQIAKNLDRDHIPTPGRFGDNIWRASSLSYILKQRGYLGEATAWRWQSAGSVNGKRRMQLRAPDEQVSLPDGIIPALITTDLFECVQARLQRNKQLAVRHNKNPEATLLRGGFVRCGYCNGSMVSYTSSNPRRIWTYYCNRAHQTGLCRRHAISTRLLDQAVWERVEAVLTRPEIIRSELERMRSDDPTADDLASTDRELAAIDQQQRTLVDNLAFVTGVAAKLIAEKLVRLDEHRETLLRERDKIVARQRGWQDAQARLSDLEAWCRQVRGRLDRADYGHRRLALEALGVTVRVWRTDHTDEQGRPLRFDITMEPCFESALDGVIVSKTS